MTYFGSTTPGWYPDPYFPGATRYWDGVIWTEHARSIAFVPVGPVLDLAGGHKAADRAIKAFVVQCLITSVGALLYPAFLGTMFEQIRSSDSLDANAAPNGNIPLFNVALQPLGIIALIATILIGIWASKATANAGALGRATTHSPGWALAGWLVPVINLWYPMQIVRDLLPDHHPLRTRVTLWWCLWLGASFCILIPAGLAITVSVPAGLVASLIPIALEVSALSIICPIVRAIRDSQDEAGRTAISPG